jgi:hypothetical protein
MTFDERYKLKEQIRRKRELVCFPVINRGKLWYERLNNIQHGELRAWYQAWLDATETLVIPDDLPWLDKKLSEESDI